MPRCRQLRAFASRSRLLGPRVYEESFNTRESGRISLKETDGRRCSHMQPQTSRVAVPVIRLWVEASTVWCESGKGAPNQSRESGIRHYLSAHSQTYKGVSRRVLRQHRKNESDNARHHLVGRQHVCGAEALFPACVFEILGTIYGLITQIHHSAIRVSVPRRTLLVNRVVHLTVPFASGLPLSALCTPSSRSFAALRVSRLPVEHLSFTTIHLGCRACSLSTSVPPNPPSNISCPSTASQRAWSKGSRRLRRHALC